MITIIDYGGSNLRSVQKALESIGARLQVAASAEEIGRANKLVLPGVGAFGAGMAALRRRGLEEAIRARVAQGVPLLGICLGMQFLFERSEEMGRHAGLGLLAGDVVRFPAGGPKIPHMGWNQLLHDEDHPLLRGVPSDAYTYFVHSYYCRPADQATVIARAEYGLRFAAIVGRDNIYGIQFHPEKSQRVGLTILRNFAEMDGLS
ncbi:MAG: imidazole glycerol phosphate synthase subunit HisH [Chloroflexota bacterium]|jgi:glutamine amidotransferase